MAVIFFSFVVIYAFEQTWKFIFSVYVHCLVVVLYVRSHNKYSEINLVVSPHLSYGHCRLNLNK